MEVKMGVEVSAEEFESMIDSIAQDCLSMLNATLELARVKGIFPLYASMLIKEMTAYNIGVNVAKLGIDEELMKNTEERIRLLVNESMQDSVVVDCTTGEQSRTH